MLFPCRDKLKRQLSKKSANLICWYKNYQMKIAAFQIRMWQKTFRRQWWYIFSKWSITLQSLTQLFPVYRLNVPAGHLRGADILPGQLHHRNTLIIYITFKCLPLPFTPMSSNTNFLIIPQRSKTFCLFTSLIGAHSNSMQVGNFKDGLWLTNDQRDTQNKAGGRSIFLLHNDEGLSLRWQGGLHSLQLILTQMN